MAKNYYFNQENKEKSLKYTFYYNRYFLLRITSSLYKVASVISHHYISSYILFYYFWEAVPV